MLLTESSASRINSDLRQFLFGGVDLGHRMSHARAPHVPLGVVLRVGRDEPAAARVSAARAAPLSARRIFSNTAGLPFLCFRCESLQPRVSCSRARVRRPCYPTLTPVFSGSTLTECSAKPQPGKVAGKGRHCRRLLLGRRWVQPVAPSATS